MQTNQTTQVVQNAYAAFGRGDIPAVLDALADDIVWEPVIGASLGENVTFEQFEPPQFIAEGDVVVALGHYRARTKRGTTFESDSAMVFTVRNGRVARFREFTDSAAINAAFAPQ